MLPYAMGLLRRRSCSNREEWRRYLAIEVMSCIGGCLNGGGEPKSDVKDVVQRRAASIYSIDKGPEEAPQSREQAGAALV